MKTQKATRDERITDVAFEDFADVRSISTRLHPLDVGFDLRGKAMSVDIPNDEPAVVSYATRSGERRVMEGPRDAVVSRLRGLGYEVQG